MFLRSKPYAVVVILTLAVLGQAVLTGCGGGDGEHAISPEEEQSIVKEYEETSPESLREEEPQSRTQECLAQAETAEAEVQCLDRYGGS
jgi:hypothetical protein